MTERWEIDNRHSGIHFTIRHLVIAKVRGRFTRWSGTVLVPDGDFGRASVEAVIDTSSIDTGLADRDTHLRGADFLDAQRYPEIAFNTLRVTAEGSDRLSVVGHLTIKGLTREVSLHVEHLGQAKDPWGNERVAFTAKGSIDRREFGLTWNQALETGGMLLGDRIDIEIEVQAVRRAATQVA
jgi:polyisoprenoid-binding protein YceI